MLKIKQNYTYDWPVSVPFPGDGGTIERAEFTAKFVYMGQKALEEARQGILSDSDAAAFINRVMVGWSGVADANDKELPFSLDALRQLLDLPSVAMAIMQTYGDSLRGIAVKN